jgi:hypothetical protein
MKTISRSVTLSNLSLLVHTLLVLAFSFLLFVCTSNGSHNRIVDKKRRAETSILLFFIHCTKAERRSVRHLESMGADELQRSQVSHPHQLTSNYRLKLHRRMSVLEMDGKNTRTPIATTGKPDDSLWRFVHLFLAMT